MSKFRMSHLENVTSKRFWDFFSCHAVHILISALDAFLADHVVRLGHNYAYFCIVNLKNPTQKVKVFQDNPRFCFFLQSNWPILPKQEEGKVFLVCHDLLSSLVHVWGSVSYKRHQEIQELLSIDQVAQGQGSCLVDGAVGWCSGNRPYFWVPHWVLHRL